MGKKRKASPAIEPEQCSVCRTSRTDIILPAEIGLSGPISSVRLHRDHIIPRANGGTTIPANLRWACWLCNYIRRNLDVKYDHCVAAASRAFWAALKNGDRIEEVFGLLSAV